MRFLNRIVLTVGLALTVASQAGAVTVSLVDITPAYGVGAGFYDGVSANFGDLLYLDIVVTLGPADAVTLVDPAITFGPEVVSVLPLGPAVACPFPLVSPFEVPLGFKSVIVDCESPHVFFLGPVTLNPIVVATDIGPFVPGQLDGWEAQTVTSGGAAGPATFTLGQAVFKLSGAGGTIAVGAVGLPNGTVIGDGAFQDITGVSTLGSFTVVGPCQDGIDNDSDGSTDHPADPGCDDPITDSSERSTSLPCDDGVDNDLDGRVDFDPVTFASPGDQNTPPAGVGDPGCRNPSWSTETPQCQDGIHNDGDGKMDYDAGRSVNGIADPNGPDPQCVGKPWKPKEKKSCGLGFELALLLPLLMWLHRRRRRMNA